MESTLPDLETCRVSPSWKSHSPSSFAMVWHQFSAVSWIFLYLLRYEGYAEAGFKNGDMLDALNGLLLVSRNLVCTRLVLVTALLCSALLC